MKRQGEYYLRSGEWHRKVLYKVLLSFCLLYQSWLLFQYAASEGYKAHVRMSEALGVHQSLWRSRMSVLEQHQRNAAFAPFLLEKEHGTQLWHVWPLFKSHSPFLSDMGKKEVYQQPVQFTRCPCTLATSHCWGARACQDRIQKQGRAYTAWHLSI